MSNDVTIPTMQSDRDGDAALRSATEGLLLKIVETAREFIATFPGNPQTAGEAARNFGLSRKIVWQLYRVATAEDLLSALSFVPGAGSCSTLVKAAVQGGASSATGLQLELILKNFDKFVELHAGDRDTLITMLGKPAHVSDNVPDQDRKHRGLIHKSYTHFYGVSVDVVSEVTMLSETTPGERYDLSLRTVQGLRRLRSDATTIYDRIRRPMIQSASTADASYEPLDLRAFKEHGVPVLPAFSSKPLPLTVFNYDDEPDLIRINFSDAQTRLNEPITLTTGVVGQQQFSTEVTGREQGQRLLTMVGYPAKLYRKTYMVHMPHKRLLAPRLTTYISPMAVMSPEDRTALKPYPIQEKIETYPAGSWRTRPECFGEIREQVGYCCALMGWDPADFVIYQLEIEYPLMHSVIFIEVPWMQE